MNYLLLNDSKYINHIQYKVGYYKNYLKLNNTAFIICVKMYFK